MNNSLIKSTATPFYSSGLPPRMGWVRHLLLKLIFNRIATDTKQYKVIHALPPEAIVIYVSKTKSKFECLLNYIQSISNGLQAPRIAFDYRFYVWQPLGRLVQMTRNRFIAVKERRLLPDAYASGYIRTNLLRHRTGFLSLMGKSGFSDHWMGTATDPLEYLIVLQKQIAQPIFLIPQLIFFDNRPLCRQPNFFDILFGSKQNPGRLRRLWALFRNPKDIFVEISEPLNLKSFLQNYSGSDVDDEQITADLRQQLLDQINAHRRRVTGPVIKSTEELRQTVLTSPNLTRYIQRHSARRKVTLAEARKEASKYFDEIAAKYSLRFVALGSAVTRWFLRHIFDHVNVDVEGLNRIKRKHLKGPLVFIPCHKSNFDNITLMAVLYANHLHCPHTFAGKNLSFWPIGPFFRRTGAFFMRRSFKGAVFYAMVFSEYVQTLLREGHNLEIFIEGTRSRSGKLLPPQTGGLSLLINACQGGACSDLVFIPVSIGYDRIPEEDSYLDEIQGGQKTKESFWAMIKGGRILKSRYGQIYFHFADPITLSAVFEQENLSISKALKGKKLNRFSYSLGQRLLYEIQCKAVITPQSLIAAALLSLDRQNFTAYHLTEIVETYLAYLATRNVLLSDNLTLNPTAAITQALEYYLHRRVIEPIKTMGPYDQFKILTNKRNSLDFYKNNVIGHLAPAAFTALVILSIDIFQFEANHLHFEYASLKELFRNEFFFEPDQTTAYQVRKAIKAFIDAAILVPHPTLPDTYNLTSPGYRKLQFFARLLKPLFESYLVVLSCYREMPAKPPSKKNRIKAMRSLAQSMRKKNQLGCPEAISEAYFNQADAVFSQMGFQKKETSKRSEKWLTHIQAYLKILS
jgi:glycerol-3-phosphate O-acyltransferase